MADEALEVMVREVSVGGTLGQNVSVYLQIPVLEDLRVGELPDILNTCPT